ncbi:hypothetical protein B7463_g10317, partial [Scytalidium lignicola]
MAESDEITRLLAAVMDLSTESHPGQEGSTEDQEKKVPDSSSSSSSSTSTIRAVTVRPAKLAPPADIFPPSLDPTKQFPPPKLPIRIPPTPITLSNNKSDFFSPLISPPIAPHHPVVYREMMRKTWKHVERRQPFAQSASAKLQAIVGVRNETPFQVPETPVPPVVLNLMRQSRDQNNRFARDGFLNNIRGYGRGPGQVGVGGVGIGVGGPQRGGGYDIPLRSPIGMHVVNKYTGAGLREFLLTRGNELGSGRRELKSISFFDCTPDIRTNAEKSVKLAEYDNRSPRHRCNYYEVDLPTVRYSNVTPGQEIYSTERWIWFLISQPMVTIDFDMFVNNPSQKLPHPPNFPSPAPTSWVVFAAPLSHVTTYPITTELEYSTPNPTFNYNGNYNGSNNVRNLHLVSKRLDFDFSHQGIPLFEFSNINNFTSTSTLPFLSIPRPLPPYEENDSYAPYTDDEYEEILSRWEESEEYANRNRPADDPMDLPCPNRGVWWNRFYKELYDDCKTWEKIKAAMGRGKCRVMCRWLERDEESEREEQRNYWQGVHTGGWGRDMRAGIGMRGRDIGGRGGAFRGRGFMGRARSGTPPHAQAQTYTQHQMNQRPHSNLSRSF